MVDRWEEKWNLLFPVNNRCNFLVIAHHTVKLFVTAKVHVHAALSSETGSRSGHFFPVIMKYVLRCVIRCFLLQRL